QARRLDREHAQAACERLAVRVGLVECVHLVDRDSLATIESGDAKAHALPVRDVGVFAGAARAAVLAEGKQVEIATVRAGLLVDVGPAPGVGGYALLEVGPGPARLGARLHDERLQPLLARRIVPDVEPERVERLVERVDLRARDLDLGLAD